MEASEDGIGKGGPEQWQNDLERRFGTTIDASLITALVHEPGQTYNEVYATLLSLAGDEQDRSSNTAIEKDGGLDSNAASSATLVDTHEIERTLEEWKLADDEANNAENLRLTDDEETPSAIKGAEREATALGDATGKGELPVHELAAGQVDIAARHEAGEVASGFAFLTHAFPTRTPAFLHSILDDEKGDVQKAVETLMTLELVENGGLDHESSDAAQAGRTSSRLTDDDDGLFNGRQTKKLTKRDRQRRKYEQAQSQGLHASKTSVAQRVNLTDVRQGALPTRRIAKMRPEHETRSIWSADATENEDDEALAARLAREERIAAGLPPDAKDEEDDVVADNDWLFSSSVLEQLSVLMGIADHVVKATHAACHMNLRATLHRLIFMQTQAFPTLTSLDAHTDSDEGTSEAVVVNLNHLLPAKSRKEIEQFYRATGGQEDAVLDLVQLADRIEASAVGDRTDILDPMKTDRKTAEVYAPASTLQASHDAGHFAFVDGNNGLAASATPYASAAGRTNASKSMAPARQYALQRLQQGAASVTFPLNSAAHASSSSSAATDDGASVETAAQAARLAHEYTLIAHEYRQRRQEYLSKAASSYRSTHNAAISRGPMRGAAAWVYAEEARRLDAKARAFALQAAQATVRYRTLINRSSSSSAVHSGNSRGADMAGEQGDVIDLHGVTVHQALSITRQSLNTWWSKNQYKTSAAPLHLITGVGRHSKGQIALIRPAVLAMLQRERWNCREQQTGHIVVLGRH
jgi:hypothetical protein